LVRNEDYWGTRGKPKRIIFRPVPEEQTRVAELLAGSVDVIIPVFPDSIAQIENHQDTKIIKVPGLTVWYVVLNLDKAPFNNVKVRQALNYAIDKQAIVHDVLKDTGIVATQAVHPMTWGYNPEARTYTYDPAKARSLLAEAGYANGFNATLWVPESGSGMQLPKEMSQVIQANFAAVGVNVRLEVFEWGTYLSKIRQNDRSFDMAALSWYLKVSDPDLALYPLFHSESVPFVNYMQYNNPEVDKLLLQGREVFDEAERRKIYHKIIDILNEEVPLILVDHQFEVLGVRANVEGVTMNPNGWFLGVETAYHVK
jgi:peptide/nickel transport system substrate-binding protein